MKQQPGFVGRVRRSSTRPTGVVVSFSGVMEPSLHDRWYMRGDENARDLVEGLPNITLSAVTYMELVQGMRNKVELAALDTALARWKAKPEAIGREISEHAVLLVRRYFSVTHYEWRTP
uniref:PIN domain-containing protein n=1 Tax=Candidatus Kentrum sp. SD TaxID=2126332 RepID=A0A451BPD9_9GAMM|nr:MAG: hypothetical protein BECKSD772D_GA0070982_108813 [Candidatus Kentron sp. SD]